MGSSAMHFLGHADLVLQLLRGQDAGAVVCASLRAARRRRVACGSAAASSIMEFVLMGIAKNYMPLEPEPRLTLEQPRVLIQYAAVHDHVHAACAGALGSRFIYRALLHPDVREAETQTFPTMAGMCSPLRNTFTRSIVSGTDARSG